jgi:hypothetical protein
MGPISLYSNSIGMYTTGGMDRNHSPGRRDGMTFEYTITDRSFLGPQCRYRMFRERHLVIQTRTFKGDYHLNENDEYMKKS